MQTFYKREPRSARNPLNSVSHRLISCLRAIMKEQTKPIVDAQKVLEGVSISVLALMQTGKITLPAYLAD